MPGVASFHLCLASQDDSKALGSFKGEYGSFPIGSKKVVLIRQEVRSDEECQKLFEKNPAFSIENIKLADEVTEERIEIKNDEQEKEIIRIYFDGDRAKYLNSLINK